MITPLGVSRLGLINYGIWVLATQLPNLLIAPDLGLGNGIINDLSSVHRQDGNLRSAHRTLVGLAKLLSVVAMAWLVLGVIGSVLYAQGAASNDSRVRLLMALMASLVCFVSSVPATGWLRAQLAQERGHKGVLWEGAGKGLALVLSVIVLLVFPDPVLMVIAYLLPSSFAIWGNALAYIRKEFSGVAMHTTPSFMEAFRDNRHLFGVGGYFLILQLCYVASTAIDPYLVNSTLSISDVTYLSIARRPFDLLPLVVSLYSTALWPVFARLHGNSQRRKLRFAVLGFAGGGGSAVVLAGFLIVALATPIYDYFGQGNVSLPTSDLVWLTLQTASGAMLLVITNYLYAISAVRTQVHLMVPATAIVLAVKVTVLLSTGSIHAFIIWGAIAYIGCIAAPMTMLALRRLSTSDGRQQRLGIE